MTKKFDKTFHVKASPERVMEVMRDPAFIEATERTREKKEEAALTFELKKGESPDSYEVVTTNYYQGLSIDLTKTEERHTKVAWDRDTKQSAWEFSCPQHDKISIKGGNRLIEQDGETELAMSAEVTANQLFAGMIEGAIQRGFEQGWVNYVDLLDSWLKKR